MRENISDGISRKLLLRSALFTLLLPVVLFIAAGRLNWVMGWIYVVMLISFTAISRIVVIRRNPELMMERFKFTKGDDAKAWDKVIAPLIVLCSIVIWIVAGLDMRFGWSSPTPFVLQIVAMVFVALGYLLASWAMVANKFFSAVFRIQKDRGHIVATGGPYQYVRHPGYVGGIVSDLATAPALGSLWALIPAALSICLHILRTVLEDRTLRKELDGYEDYAQHVRYRLLPGLW